MASRLGTSTHGAMRDIVFTNSVIHSNDEPISERVIAGLAIEMVDGGTLDRVLVSNISMRNVRTPIFVRLGTRKESAETHLRDVSISGICAVGALVTSSITGVPGHPVEDISISDVRISSAEQGWTRGPITWCRSLNSNTRSRGCLGGCLPSACMCGMGGRASARRRNSLGIR